MVPSSVRSVIALLCLIVLILGTSARHLSTHHDLRSEMLVPVNSTKLDSNRVDRSVEGSGDSDLHQIKPMPAGVATFMERLEQRPTHTSLNEKESIEDVINEDEGEIETLQDEGSGHSAKVEDELPQAAAMLEQIDDPFTQEEGMEDVLKDLTGDGGAASGLKRDDDNRQDNKLSVLASEEHPAVHREDGDIDGHVVLAEDKEEGSGMPLSEIEKLEEADTQIIGEKPEEEKIVDESLGKGTSDKKNEDQETTELTANSRESEETYAEIAPTAIVHFKEEESATDVAQHGEVGNNEHKEIDEDVETREYVQKPVSEEVVVATKAFGNLIEPENVTEMDQAAETLRTLNISISSGLQALIDATPDSNSTEEENTTVGEKNVHKVNDISEEGDIHGVESAIEENELIGVWSNGSSEQDEVTSDSTEDLETPVPSSSDPTVEIEVSSHDTSTEEVTVVPSTDIEEIHETTQVPQTVFDSEVSDETTEAPTTETPEETSSTQDIVDTEVDTSTSPTSETVTDLVLVTSSEASPSIETTGTTSTQIEPDPETSTDLTEQATEVIAPQTTEDSDVENLNGTVLLVAMKEDTAVENSANQVHVPNVKESSASRSFSMYIIVGVLIFCFVILVVVVTLRNRGRRRKMRTENGQDRDTEKALLGLGKFKDDSEENNIKNNEITPLVIKQNSQINKFEKSPNFSSPKNLNTTANEKNIEKDNVLKSTTQAIIEGEVDEVKKAVEDDVEEEKKRAVEQLGPLGAEKVVVHTHMDLDSIPRKPVLVSRNGHTYHAVPGGETKT